MQNDGRYALGCVSANICVCNHRARICVVEFPDMCATSTTSSPCPLLIWNRCVSTQTIVNACATGPRVCVGYMHVRATATRLSLAIPANPDDFRARPAVRAKPSSARVLAASWQPSSRPGGHRSVLAVIATSRRPSHRPGGHRSVMAAIAASWHPSQRWQPYHRLDSNGNVRNRVNCNVCHCSGVPFLRD